MRKCETRTTNKFIITPVIIYQVANSILKYNSFYSPKTMQYDHNIYGSVDTRLSVSLRNTPIYVYA